eukprot:scaffold3872_cov113-Skeletonema_dohrnii-CCMP3373.AAC.5
MDLRWGSDLAAGITTKHVSPIILLAGALACNCARNTTAGRKESATGGSSRASLGCLWGTGSGWCHR